MGKTRETGNIVSDGLVSVDIANDQFKVGTGVTIYGSSGIISATSLYVDGIEITGSGLFESTATGIHTLSSVGIGTTARGNALSVGGTITELYNGSYWNVVTQADVGYGASQVPLNQYLGQLAFLDDHHPNGLRRDGGGSDDVFVDSSGLVGVNTTVPEETLTVYKEGVAALFRGDNYAITALTTTPRLRFGTDTSYAGYMELGAYNSINNLDTKGRDFNLFSSSVDPILYVKNGTGNIGIGTNNPSDKLHVYSSGANTISTIDSVGGDAGLQLRNSGNGNWSGINFIRERSTGTNVIGGSIWMPSVTANNSALLYIQTQTASANAGADGALTDNNGVRLKLASQPNGVADDSAFSVEVGSQERFRITSAGDVGIGTDSPTAKLDVDGTLNVSGVATFLGDVSFGSTVTFGDDDKIILGDGGFEFQIYHNGSNSIIRDNGPGNFILASNGDAIKLTKGINTEDLAIFNVGGAVELYYNNSKKFETRTDGIKVLNGTSETAVISGPQNIILDPSPDDVVAITTGNISGANVTTITGITTTDIAIGNLIQEVDGIISTGTTVTSVGVSQVGISKTSLGAASSQEFLFVNQTPTGIVRVKGDLYVDGTRTEINSSTLTINDLNVIVASGAANGLDADGAGLVVDGADAHLKYHYNAGSNETFELNKNVGIGTDNATEKLDVRGHIKVDEGPTLENGGSGNLQVSTDYGYLRLGPQNSSYSHFYTDLSRFYFNKKLVVDTGTISSYNEDLILQTSEYNGPTERVRILTSNGYVGINSTSPSAELDVNGEIKTVDINVASDANLKTNIKTIKDPLEKVLKIRGVTFDWKENLKSSAGVIAQEVEEVLPELVKDKGSKSVNYNGLIGLLIEAVKAQQEEINMLKDRLK
jgi:hypothetical protein